MKIKGVIRRYKEIPLPAVAKEIEDDSFGGLDIHMKIKGVIRRYKEISLPAVAKEIEDDSFDGLDIRPLSPFISLYLPLSP